MTFSRQHRLQTSRRTRGIRKQCRRLKRADMLVLSRTLALANGAAFKLTHCLGDGAVGLRV